MKRIGIFLRFLWFDNVFSEQPKIVRNQFARVIFGVTIYNVTFISSVIRQKGESQNAKHTKFQESKAH